VNGQARIVFVDDNVANLKLYSVLARQLEGPVQIETFSVSASALRRCQADEPDLIVLDYRMPPPDGLEFIRDFRRTHPDSDTPIIMITGDSDREIRHRALAMGASDFLNKPADPVEFLSRVRNLLKLHERGVRLANHAANLAEEVRQATHEIADREHETITRLMRALEYRDNDTGMHVVRMGQYAHLIGRVMKLSDEQQDLLLRATPMHDIGKVSTPDHVLLKPGKLDPAEWALMRDHSKAGYDILSGSSSRILQMAAEIALSHHERWDGAGYPAGLRGEAIPLSARICAVGDVFDALMSNRPYKRSWRFEDAMTLIQREGGKHFDPVIAQWFVRSSNEVQDILRRFADAPVVAA
jgi:putative two-component system response regulator